MNKPILKYTFIIIILIQNTNILMGEYANKFGIKYRLSQNLKTHELGGLRKDKNSDRAIQLSDRGLGDRKYSLPVNFVFKETLFGDNFYGSMVFDIFLPQNVKDLPPKWTENDGDKELIRNYLNSEDKEICSFDDDSNCAISADLNSSNVLLGYLVGGYFGNKTHRYIAIGLGPVIFYNETNIDLLICTRYKREEENGSTSKQGVCEGKQVIDNSYTKDFYSGYTLNWGIYEYRGGDFHFSIFKYFGHSIEFKTNFSKHPQLKYFQNYQHFEIISYTSVF